ncbi:FAD-binding domain-containing protein [Pseudovirgaria hyperparasitica]|uniref:FAD-binding domain-containing protein n=1 Tax=Pseudovirgaria hyperparasitica TaxID=470096 RepID=A0A6A6WJQ0_9PEZI|nr:FAD-binding domain-containing protein [Pseudovirgaria hyperparasitica]KAF2762067.1 FAD-binding domain-containing protein [Pseudovirgaria hyperparasitica]
MVKITGITGAQFEADTPEYDTARIQYATFGGNHDDQGLDPLLIIKPKNKDDIKLALAYANEQRIAVAIRTGGHQYSGASSTTSQNIQIDLSETFAGEWFSTEEIDGEHKRSLVRVSVSWRLNDFNAMLGANGLFVPHGQCGHVMLGGHVQTGGYGQLGRSFGLLSDHVRTLEIITHDGQELEVDRTHFPELFYAMLGGSPGNFGVLTHVTLEVHRDQDHQGARAMKAGWLYDPAVMKRLTDMVVQMGEDDNFPANFDLCVSVIDHGADLPAHGFDNPALRDSNDLGPPMIVVYAQWVPLTPGEVFDERAQQWFTELGQGAFQGNTIIEAPMSKITPMWIFPNPREYNLPYVKRAYVTNSKTLSKDGWAQWVTDRCTQIVGKHAEDLHLAVQLQCFGGGLSKFKINADNGTSLSWRRDSTIVAVLDCFHDEDSKVDAEQWQNVNDEQGVGPKGIFSREDRRVLWGSYGEWDLDKVWNCYYEDREKYEKLGEIRKIYDPNGVFTSNPFSVKRAV